MIRGENSIDWNAAVFRRNVVSSSAPPSKKSNTARGRRRRAINRRSAIDCARSSLMGCPRVGMSGAGGYAIVYWKESYMAGSIDRQKLSIFVTAALPREVMDDLRQSCDVVFAQEAAPNIPPLQQILACTQPDRADLGERATRCGDDRQAAVDACERSQPIRSVTSTSILMAASDVGLPCSIFPMC